MEVKLIVARHGNTFNKDDVILRVGSRTDLPLTEEGIKQGRQLGANLSASGLIPTRFFSAPLSRTVRTCEEAARVFGVVSPPESLDFLTELDYGEYDGLPEIEVVQRVGEEEAKLQQIRVVDADEFVQLGKAALKRWDQEVVLPSAWNFLQPRVDSLGAQWKNFANRLVSAPEEGTTSLAVTSNGIARFALEILPIGAERPESLKLATGAYGLFIWNGSEWRLEAWNVR